MYTSTCVKTCEIGVHCKLTHSFLADLNFEIFRIQNHCHTQGRGSCLVSLHLNCGARGVTRGLGASTCAYPKKYGFRVGKKIKGRQTPKKNYALRAILDFPYPTLNPGDAPVSNRVYDPLCQSFCASIESIKPSDSYTSFCHILFGGYIL